METKRTQILLQKYYDGISTPEEELDLLEYFSENEVPEEWKSAKEQLLGFHDIRDEEISIPEDLQQSIIKNLEPLQIDKKVKRLNTRPIYSVISVAASIVLIASALLFMNRQPDLGSFDDPDIAYAETKEALNMVSKYFNQGTEKLTNLGKMEEAVKPLVNLKKVDDTRRTLGYLNSFEQGIKATRGIIKTDEQ